MPAIEPSIRPRPLACYHEAGHCLARWYFGRHFDRAVVLSPAQLHQGVEVVNRRAQVVENAEGFLDGYEVLSPLFPPSVLDTMGGDPATVASLRVQTWSAVAVQLVESHAGVAAEARYTKRGITAAFFMGGSGDWATIRQVLDTWFPDEAAKTQAALLAERRATALVRSKAGWQAVTAIAHELMAHGEITWEAASPICETAYGREWRFLNWNVEGWLPSPEAIRRGE